MTTTTDDAPRDDDVWSGRLSPADVHGVLFTRAGFGRRGYEETEVDVFLDRVQTELRRLITEKGELREEAVRWREAARANEDGGTGPRRDEASAQAVSILSAAQQTADQYVSDAEHYSRRVSSEAREHYEQLIEQARQQAKEILDGAERVAEHAADQVAASDRGDATPSQQELQEQVAYLQTFGQVCRVQLRSYLEALLRDIEEEWGRADPRVFVPDALTRAPAHAGTDDGDHIDVDRSDADDRSRAQADRVGSVVNLGVSTVDVSGALGGAVGTPDALGEHHRAARDD